MTWIRSHLLKKSLIENFIFYAVWKKHGHVIFIEAEIAFKDKKLNKEAILIIILLVLIRSIKI